MREYTIKRWTESWNDSNFILVGSNEKLPNYGHFQLDTRKLNVPIFPYLYSHEVLQDFIVLLET